MTSLFPHHAFTRQAEENARQRLREAFGPAHEEAAMRRVADLRAAAITTLDAAVDAVIALAGQEPR